MRTALLFIIFFKLYGIQRTNLEQFAPAGNRNVHFVSTALKLGDIVKFDRSRECPELLVALFNKKGRRISVSSFTKSEFFLTIRDRKSKLYGPGDVCVLIGGHIYHLKGSSYCQ